jgi:hypothetical protein
MRLVGSQDGIGIALKELVEPVSISFVPSPYCNPDIKEHRRVEVVKDLKNNTEFRSIGICKHAGCNGKKYYKQENLLMFTLTSAIQPQSTVRRYDE